MKLIHEVVVEKLLKMLKGLDKCTCIEVAENTIYLIEKQIKEWKGE